VSNHLITSTFKANLKTNLRKSVMLLLADKASDDGTGIWASKQTMAAELCCSKQSVITTIKAFIDEGLLIVTGQRQSPNGYTHVYAINITALLALEKVSSCRDNQSSTLTGQADLPVKHVDVTSQAGGPEPSETIKPLVSPNGDTSPSLKPEHVVEAWNAMAEPLGLSRVRVLSKGRMRSLKARLREFPDVDDWTEAIGAIERSPFLQGREGKGGWRANFDFLLQPSSFIKLIEGSYDRQSAA